MKPLTTRSTALVFALALTVTPLLAYGQTDSANQQKSDTSSMTSDTGSKGAAKKQNGNTDGKRTSSDTGTSSASGGGDTFLDSQQKGQLLSGELTGVSVKDSQGNDLGDVENVLIDRKQGIDALVIGVGGFLGIGTKSVAVDFDKFQMNRAEDGSVQLVFQATKDELKNAPTFKTLAQKKAEEQARKQQQKAQQQMQQSGATTGTGVSQ